MVDALSLIDDGPGKRRRRKQGNNVPNPYGIYSGIVNESGPSEDPTELEALKNMIEYMKRNNSSQSDHPSNIYRLPWEHHSINPMVTVPIAKRGGMTSAMPEAYGDGGGIGDILKLLGKGEEGDGAAGTIDAGVGSVVDLIGAFSNHGPHNKGARSKAIGGAIGTAAGTFLPIPGGSAIGKTVGSLIGGLIGGKKDEEAIAEEEFNKERKLYNVNDLQTNFAGRGDQYGDGGGAGYPAAANPAQAQAPAMRQINVEKGELMVDPKNGQVVQKFTNPNRFGSHRKHQMMEPVGNFVTIPEGHIIIPRKFAARYERGDNLTRTSIMKQLLSDQVNDPYHNVPDEQKPTEQMGMGGAFGILGTIVEQLAGKKQKEYYGDNFGSGGATGPGPLFSKGILDLLREGGLDDILPVNLDLNKTGNPLMLSNAKKDNQLWGFSEDINGDPAPDSPISKVIGAEKPKVNFEALLRKATNNLPIYAQMANASKEDPYLHKNVNHGYNDTIGYAGQLPDEISVAGNLFANDNSFAGATRGLMNNDTPSVRAEMGEMYARKLASDNQVYQGKSNADASLRSAKINKLLGLTVDQGADNENASNLYMTEQRMDKAARENITMVGLTNLSQNELKSQNDKMSLQAINSMTHFFDINPYAKKIVTEDPTALPYIINYMQANSTNDIQAAMDAYKRDAERNVTTTTKTGNTTQKVVTKKK